MAKSEKIVAVMNRNATESGEKSEGKLTNNKTLGPYKHHIGVLRTGRPILVSSGWQISDAMDIPSRP